MLYKLIFTYDLWEKKFYRKIRQTLGIDELGDIKATRILSDLLDEMLVSDELILNKIHDKIHYKPCVVFGCGPSIDDALQNMDLSFFRNKTLISADGATTALLDAGLIPDIIVSDLDGRVDDQLYANNQGTIMLVHGHGDNIPAIKEWVPKFSKYILGTTQNRPLPHVYNFYGFTDGDRAVFLCCSFGAKEIHLVGMDFGSIVGKFSKPYLKDDTIAPERKIKKLRIAQELLEYLFNETDCKKIKRVSYTKN